MYFQKSVSMWMAIDYIKLLNTYWQSSRMEKLLQVRVIRFLKNIIELQGSRVMHMLLVAQATCCGEIYWSACITCHIAIIFTIQWKFDFSLCGTGRFQEQGQCFFIGLSCSIPTIYSLSLLSVYRLVLWGWGLRTDRVYITLSQPCTADLF